MNADQPNGDRRAESRGSDDARAINETLSRIGDAAGPGPTWQAVAARHAAQPRRWLPGLPPNRPGPVVLATVMVALVTAVGGLVLVNRTSSGGTELDTVDDPTGTSVTARPDSTSTSSGDDDDTAGRTAFPLGCRDDGQVSLAVRGLDTAAEADIDGDGTIDRIVVVDNTGGAADETTVRDGDDEPVALLVAHLGAGGWIISEAPPLDVPTFATSWPVGADLDGDGDDELLGEVMANNFSRVVVYDRAGCTIAPVPIEGRDQYEFGFPVMARGLACKDTCNVSLLCRSGGGLTSIRSEPRDPDDRYGLHRWTTVDWELVDGALVEVDERTGSIDWDRMGEIGPVNGVGCPPG